MLDVKQTLNDAGERMEMAAMYLGDELQRIRAGRANVAILDGVRVDSYGSKVPLNQVATVMVPDARTIAIKPWDRKAIKDIEKAIMDSDVGITPENNGEMIRLNLPQPTEERRRELVKQCNKIGERTKVEIRNVRSDIKDKLKKAIKDGLSEDNEKDAENDLQKLHDKYIKQVDALLEEKQKERRRKRKEERKNKCLKMKGTSCQNCLSDLFPLPSTRLSFYFFTLLLFYFSAFTHLASYLFTFQ